ncbi:hypothetical protein RclHR1_05620007 [Rhizophagus clarus]|uniref:Uncharacterized protein n=1 Tax=Rhizophagus clarus TaxID=94130 RepID=A0A2Z6RU38_9GLOM|nr:hypothetical protein RclHR1_05620007 [Rhizophagus clarus]
MEFLTVHDYDKHIQNQQELRSMKYSKLVNFILHSLHNTKDYIESANILFEIFENIEQKDYLNNFIILTICDWPNQINLRRAITLKLNKKDNSEISSQILIYHNLFGENKILVQKPKSRLIDLILSLTFYEWKNIRNLIINRFENIKDIEYLTMIDLLDNSLPFTLKIYTKLFKCRIYEGYLESIVKIWVLFQRLQRHNYNKAPLIFLSNVFYWTLNEYPIIDILKNNLSIFNDYFVENFYSSLRYQTAESNTNIQIIQKAKVIDIERNDKEFKNAFINIYHNLGRTKNNSDETIEFPTKNKFCDAENYNIIDSSSNIVLICEHSYHKECLNLLNEKYKYCFNYLLESIKTNITSLNKRLFKPLKDNEILEITKDNDLNENYENENIEILLEQTEQNIDQ